MTTRLEPWKPTRRDPWDRDAAAHLWRRAGFGAPASRVEATLGRTPAEAVDRLVDGPARDPATDELDALWRSLLGLESLDRFRAWLVTRMARCDHQLREKMALFWHGHFATSIAKVREPVWMMRQYRLFLRHGLGPFGRLLEKIARDPAMIRWLDNDTNRKGRPNENFARELFELFTLGPGHYTEHDIREAARAFTGWAVLRDRFHFSPRNHDDGPKTVLGRTGRWGGEDVLGIAIEQEACGRFLAGKLLRFFVHPRPPRELVDAFGAQLRRRGYDLGPALRVLFRSEAFFSAEARRSLVKSPLEFVVGSLRCLGGRPDARSLLPALREMGQELLAPPNVKGWPGQRSWIHTAAWLARINTAASLAGRIDPRVEGAAAVRRYGRDLLGRPVRPEVAETLVRSGAGSRDLVRALLSLPECHLG
ncbi:MAG: DUF1800 family protein [Planctomycetota bacterium]